MFRKFFPNAFVWIEQIKSSRKVLYHFAIFAKVNKILLKIAEYWSSIIFYSNIINFTEKLQKTKIIYFLRRILRIFSEFFIYFLI